MFAKSFVGKLMLSVLLSCGCGEDTPRWDFPMTEVGKEVELRVDRPIDDHWVLTTSHSS
jgi:hypothetical protein